jgi:peptidoglycan/LPS O-acetylase OafA/YrhL
MKSVNIDYLPRLDHLRLLAAALVFVFHVYHVLYGHWQPNTDSWMFGWIIEGHTGVSLFFVLSGYLFMTIALRHGGAINYRGFMRNRFLRIFPLFLFIFFVAISLSRDSFRSADWGYLFFSNLGQAPTSNYFITGAAWTISVEFTFYLIFPFLARFSVTRGSGYLGRLIFLLALFKLGAWFSVERPMHLYYSTLLGRLDQFLIGMMAAFTSKYMTEKNIRLNFMWLAGAVVLVWGLLAWQSSAFSYFSDDQHSVYWIFWGTIEAVGWASVILAYRHWRGNIWKPATTFMEAGGRISFSFYLWHGLIIFLWEKTIGTMAWTPVWQMDFAVQTLVLAAVTWLVARISFTTIEQPFLDLRGRYGGKTK